MKSSALSAPRLRPASGTTALRRRLVVSPAILSLAWASLAFASSIWAAPASASAPLEPLAPSDSAIASPFPETGSAAEAPEVPLLPAWHEDLTAQLTADPLNVLQRSSDGRKQRILDAALEFYEIRGWDLAWADWAVVPGIENRVRRTLAAAADHGLRPNEYRIEEISTLLAEPGRDLRTEAATTLSLLLMAEHLSRGRLDPDDFDLEWHLEPRRIDLAQALADFARDGDLLAVAPAAQGYRDLRTFLLRERRTLALVEEPAAVPEGETIEPGEPVSAERLRLLVGRLEYAGVVGPRQSRRLLRGIRRAVSAARAEDPRIEEASAPTTPVDPERPAPALPLELPDERIPCPEAISKAVEAFQLRSGLLVDGKVGPNTLAAINRSALERLELIAVNLERWRWVPTLPRDRYIWVNVPSFRLEAFDQGRRVLEMPVVVGKASWQTPLFRDEMTHVVMNPYWNVPRSIALNETVPAIQKDPGYLYEKGFELLAAGGETIDPASVDWEEIGSGNLPFRFRQRPGPTNALGQIKFLFPNRHSVYLHDTPAQRAFERNQRDRSHGCVRVSRPLDLARYVFAETPEWNRRKVRRILEDDERVRTRANLERALPVWLVYFTAYRGDDGSLWLRDDIYGFDQVLRDALTERYGEGTFLPELEVPPRAGYQRARKPRVSTWMNGPR